jgi:hypothetical protein
MSATTASAFAAEPIPHLTARVLPQLANFRDPDGHAVSFFFSLQSIPDKSHHTEIVLIRDLVREQARRLDVHHAPALAKDLEIVLSEADDVRANPRSWRILYADHHAGLLQKYQLPAPKSMRLLHIGEHFLLAPMFRAMEYCTPFGVVIFERGRARAFVVRGFDIQEFSGSLPKEKIAPHVRDGRIAWIQHVDEHVEEHVRKYFKELAAKVRLFLTEKNLKHVVFGCHEFLWGEAEPAFADFEKSALLGRFVPAAFDASAAEIRNEAYPMFENHRRAVGQALLDEIQGNPAHGAMGAQPVMERLIEARVRILLLGRPIEGTLGECDNCGHVLARTDEACIFCGSTKVHAIAAEEALVRQAVLTDAEILTFDADEVPVCRGAAALLRY